MEKNFIRELEYINIDIFILIKFVFVKSSFINC